MTQRKIVIEPDPILREKSASLEKVDDEIRALLDDMLETMYAAPGIGLAAVQVGILKRLIVIDISKDEEKKNPLFLINPEIISRSQKKSIYEEGCLSLPGILQRLKDQLSVKLNLLTITEKRKIYMLKVFWQPHTT